MTLAEFIAALNAKFAGRYAFEIMPGRKFTRVVQVAYGQRSSYAFVDGEGNVYKSAGWKAPAKGVRANLATLDMARVDEYGSWLYIR